MTKRGYNAVYNGGVFDRQKADSYGYLSFRAAKDVKGMNTVTD